VHKDLTCRVSAASAQRAGARPFRVVLLPDGGETADRVATALSASRPHGSPGGADHRPQLREADPAAGPRDPAYRRPHPRRRRHGAVARDQHPRSSWYGNARDIFQALGYRELELAVGEAQASLGYEQIHLPAAARVDPVSVTRGYVNPVWPHLLLSFGAT
jgi:hypothetical protein